MEGGPLPLGPISSTRSPDFWTFLPQVEEERVATTHCPPPAHCTPTARPLHRTAQTRLAAAAHAAGAARATPFVRLHFTTQKVYVRRLCVFQHASKAGCTYLHTHRACVGQALEEELLLLPVWTLSLLPTLPSSLQSSRLQATKLPERFLLPNGNVSRTGRWAIVN